MPNIISTEYFPGTTSNQYIDVRLKVDIETTYSTNKSSVTVTLQYRRNNTGNTTYGTGSFTVGFGPHKDTYNRTITITEHDWVNAASSTISYSHKDDGTYPALTVSGSGSIPGTTLTSSSVSGTITFPVVPRASTIDTLVCSTSYFTGELTFKYTPKSASFYNRCNISLNLNGEYIAVKTLNLGQKATSQQELTLTLASDQLSTIYENLPATTKGTLRFTFRTYTDEYKTEVGNSGGYKEITLTIPNDDTTKPTMTMTLSPVSDFTGAIYVKSLSKVKIDFTKGAGKYGASIVTYLWQVIGGGDGGQNSTSASKSFTSGYLTTAGSIKVTGIITDSRGYSRTYSQNITVYDYTTPSLDLLTCSTTYFNGKITHKYTPPNNVFYTRCVVTLGSTVIKNETHSRASGQQTVSFSFGEGELEKIYKALPSSTRGTLKFTFQAFTDSNYSNQIGSVSAKEITLSIPDIDATKPTAKLTHTPVSFLESPFNSLYIKGKSKVCVDLTEGAGKYGAVPVSYSVTVGSQGGTPPYTSEYLSTPSAITITGTVTDSRGFSRTYTDTITPIDYNAPLLLPVSEQSSVIAARCNSAGALDANGTYLLIAAKRSYSKVMASNVQKNYCKIQYRYKVEGGSYSSWVDILAKTASSDEVVLGAVPNVTLDTLTTYVVQIRAIDDIGDATSTTIFISTEKVYMHKAGSKNALGIGKYAEKENTVDVAEDWDAIFRGKVEVKGGYIPVEIPQYSDFNNLIIPNTYYARYTYVPDFVNCPITDQTTFALEVIAMGKDGQVLQRITRCSAEATVYERQYYSYKWHEWEVVNPPMVVGEEYRTTERYMGKPVYTKLIFCDTLPNTTYKLFPHGAAVKQAIRCVGQMSDGNSLPFRFNATNYVEIYAGPENVVIFAGNDKTNRSAYAQMWYVKD